MALSTKERLTQIRDLATTLLQAPDLAPIPRRWGEVADQVQAACSLLERVPEAPRWVTRSNSRLFTYNGAVLGLRQLILVSAARQQTLLPPGFSDLSPWYLAVMGASLCQAGAFDIDPAEYLMGQDDLTPSANALVDCWETCGLGMFALPAFLWSHVHFPATGEWAPLTEDAERTTGGHKPPVV